MLEKLAKATRLLMEAPLKPVQGDRFQPTGFADLGAATYQRPNGTRMLLVETAQSMANRFEKTCLAGDGPDLAAELAGLPYVRVQLDGAVTTTTSSLIEAHRLNSPWIISDKDFKADFVKKAAYVKGHPVDWSKVATAFMFYDPNSLLHGAFMANLEDGRIKIPRALSAFIEAVDVREVASGGVKNNPLDPTGQIRAEAMADKDVYSNVPYHRTEFTAGSITLYVNLDLALIHGYGLEPPARDLLVVLALYKVRRFLASGLRLRTSCDLAVVGEVAVTAPAGFALPGVDALLGRLKELIAECATRGLLAKPPRTELKAKAVIKKKKEEASSQGAAEAAADDDSDDEGE